MMMMKMMKMMMDTRTTGGTGRENGRASGTRLRRRCGRAAAAAGFAGAAALMLGAASARPAVSAAADADGPPWGDGLPQAGMIQYHTSVATTGAIQPDHLGIANVKGGKLAIKNSAEFPARLVSRYNVTSVPNLIEPGPTAFIFALVRDNGDDARVVMRLKSVDRATGDETTLLTADSDSLTPSDDLQTLYLEVDDGSVVFNFSSNSYYIEVVITRSARAGKPAIKYAWVGTF